MKDTAAQQLTDPEIESALQRSKQVFEFLLFKTSGHILIGLGGRDCVMFNFANWMHIICYVWSVWHFIISDAFEIFAFILVKIFYILIDWMVQLWFYLMLNKLICTHYIYTTTFTLRTFYICRFLFQFAFALTECLKLSGGFMRSI